MRAKIPILLCCLFWLAACTNTNPSPPTRMPTAIPLEDPLPATNTPLNTEIEPDIPGPANIPPDDTVEADPALQEIDAEVCREAFEKQAELEALQEQGQDVTELVTAVAELVVELSYCESFFTPTPFK
jgi:hypothetical protein